MIMGIAARVVPTLNGIDPRTLSRLTGPFLMVNLGCGLRVAMQIATDWTAAAYAPIGLSGTLEVAGLAWWGLELVGVIRRGWRAEREAMGLSGAAPARIEDRHRVADILDWFPDTEPIFIRHGFTAVSHAALRRTLARRVTLRQAATLRGVDLAILLHDLNAAARRLPAGLPVISLNEPSRAKGGP
jgi:hypothetical protein